MKRFSFYTFFVSALVLLLAPELLAADQSGEAISGLALGSGIGIGIAAAGDETILAEFPFELDVNGSKLHKYYKSILSKNIIKEIPSKQRLIIDINPVSLL